MDLYLIRHAIAHERDPVRWRDDSTRPLTPQGARRFRLAALGLRTIAPSVEVLLSSPYVRAWATAEILATVGWPAPVRFDGLTPDARPAETVADLRSHESAGSVALVGHEPHLHELASFLLTGSTTAVSLSWKKGGVARLSVPELRESGTATLYWHLQPKALRALGRAGHGSGSANETSGSMS